MLVYTVYFKPSRGDFERLKKVFVYSLKKHSPGVKIYEHEVDYPPEDGRRPSHTENIYKLGFWNDLIQRKNDNEPVLLCDCDLLVTQDITDMIDHCESDISFTSREGYDWKYNAGVILVKPTDRAKRFFQRWYDVSLKFDATDENYWRMILGKYKGATQSTLAHVIGSREYEDVIGEIPCQVWNLAETEFDQFDKNTRIVHIKSRLRDRILNGVEIITSDKKEAIYKLSDLWHRYETEMIESYSDLDRFRDKLGYECNLENPQTFNEKVNWKKRNDRNPLLTLTSDKCKVKEYVDKICPGLFSHRRYSGSVDGADLTPPCVVKMNNASGRNLFILNPEQVEGAREQLKKWESMSYGQEKEEWCYRDIKPGVVVEKIIDYKNEVFRFFCFDEKVEFIICEKVIDVEAGEKKPKSYSVSIYDREWNFLPVQYTYKPMTYIDRPQELDKMIEISEKLSVGFDFVRVDLMRGDKIYFSEFTHYPVSGRMKLTPRDWDYKFGALWRMK
jgi:hypothetical protein